MRTTPGAMRQGGVAIVVVGLLVALLGIWATASAASAKPTKQPDTTANDHPSGKDRTEPQPSGASSSDPDGATNGGADKPGGTGGFDADKDGNNGCGNDDDFEDDNNGNCGGRRVRGANRAAGEAQASGAQTSGGTRTTVHSHSQAGSTGTSDAAALAGAGASPTRLSQSATFARLAGETTDHAAVAAAGDTHVLGTSFVRAPDAGADAVLAVDSYVAGGAVRSAAGSAALAATGLATVALTALGLVLIGLGATLVGVARRWEMPLA